MVKYCEDPVTCRRVLLMRHFGEDLDASVCAGGCDSCLGRGDSPFADQDLTDVAKKVVAAIRSLNGRNLRQDLQYAESMAKKVRSHH